MHCRPRAIFSRGCLHCKWELGLWLVVFLVTQVTNKEGGQLTQIAFAWMS